jgi:hypothetical protein
MEECIFVHKNKIYNIMYVLKKRAADIKAENEYGNNDRKN